MFKKSGNNSTLLHNRYLRIKKIWTHDSVSKISMQVVQLQKGIVCFDNDKKLISKNGRLMRR